MPSITTRAKLNLTLRVVGRRHDGYHMLQSLVSFAEVGDRLDAKPAPALTLSISGPESAPLEQTEENLVWRAARALQQRYGVAHGAQLYLEKRLPVASGIGGGSGDAAAALRLLATLWDLPIDDGGLVKIAQQLGADVPSCLFSQAGWMEGIGEQFTPCVSFPSCAVVLINPRIALPTPDVFRHFATHALPLSDEEVLPERFKDFTALMEWVKARPNDLLASASALCPVLESRLEALHGLASGLPVGMSGSGATCFVLCPDLRKADTIATALRKVFPDDWMVSAPMV